MEEKRQLDHRLLRFSWVRCRHFDSKYPGPLRITLCVWHLSKQWYPHCPVECFYIFQRFFTFMTLFDPISLETRSPTSARWVSFFFFFSCKTYTGMVEYKSDLIWIKQKKWIFTWSGDTSGTFKTWRWPSKVRKKERKWIQTQDAWLPRSVTLASDLSET